MESNSSAAYAETYRFFLVMTTITTIVLAILIMSILSPTRIQAFVAPIRKGQRFFTARRAGMQHLPKDVVKYSEVPKNGLFKADKIPRGLLKDHTTKSGTWGVIRVIAGTLEYTIQEPTPSVHLITAETQPGGIIEPQVKHRVKAVSDDLEFVVEFYRKPGTGPINEKREGL
ncbi:MAG: hypothetical protein SGILL_001064, partial [Bacillariaceae sp.]